MQTALILLNQNDSQKCFDPRKIGRKHPKNQLKLNSFVVSTPKIIISTQQITKSDTIGDWRLSEIKKGSRYIQWKFQLPLTHASSNLLTVSARMSKVNSPKLD